jgi:hypothetical protein
LVYVFIQAKARPAHQPINEPSVSDFPAHTLYFATKSDTRSKYIPLLAQIGGIDRAHLGQDAVQVVTIFRCKLPLEGVRDIATRGFRVQALSRDKLFKLSALFIP